MLQQQQPSKDWLTVPNMITLFRIAGIPALFMLLMQEHYHVALAWFLVLVLSDGLDGWTARRFHWVSEVGITLDPFADKVLVVPLLWYFWVHDIFSDERGFVFVLMLTLREILVTIFRVVAGRYGVQTPAQFFGKVKGIFEYAAIALIIAGYYDSGEIMLGWAVLFAIISLVQYIFTIDFLFNAVVSALAKIYRYTHRVTCKRLFFS